jgi:hypothetical protein
MEQEENMERRTIGHELSERQQRDLAYYEYSLFGYRDRWFESNQDTLCSYKEIKRGALDPLI